jgi:hypothetical protein
VSVDADLDKAFALLLQKAQPYKTDPAVRPLTVNWTFSAGGVGLSATAVSPMLVEIPYPCTIVWAHMYAGTQTGVLAAVTSAVVDVIMTQLDAPSRFAHLYGSGTIPTLTSLSVTDLNLTGWHTNLIAGDTLIARLQDFSAPTPSATVPVISWLSLTLLCRPTDVPIGLGTVEDLGANDIISAAGDTVVTRD